MIVVSGTKRSGTSMWMQILTQAGFDFLGKQFMGKWEQSIGQANPEGFYESPFRYGIFPKNNPSTAKYMHPKERKFQTIKIFASCIGKTELAFLHRVIVTLRPWREYSLSIQRLVDMEDAYTLQQPDKANAVSNQARVIIRHSPLRPALQWWRDNYRLFTDIYGRGYPVEIVTYDRLLSEHSTIIPEVIDWILLEQTDDIFRSVPIPTDIDVQKAIDAVKPDLRTQEKPVYIDDSIPDGAIDTFDLLYHDMSHPHPQVSKSLVDKLHETHQIMKGIMQACEREEEDKKRQLLRELGWNSTKIERELLARKTKKK